MIRQKVEEMRFLFTGCFGLFPNIRAQELLLKANPKETEALDPRYNVKYEVKRQSVDVRNTNTACYKDIGCFHKNGTFKHLNGLPDSPELIRTTFALYTRRNSDVPVYMNYLDYITVLDRKLDPTKELKIICHGFAMTGTQEYLIDMKNAILKKDDYNVIIIDWSRGALPPFYLSASLDTELVGRQVARLIHLLIEHRGVSEKRVHIIGFSLGSHLSGFAGKWLKKEYGLTLERISALDPASFLFEGKGDDVHISSKDADFVDVIHTSAGSDIFSGELGMTEAVGHVDFYPNGGKQQPGCGGLICNHMRALELFTNSIDSYCQFKAIPCDNFDVFDDGGCFLSNSKFGRMGYYSKSSEGRGKLYLATSSIPPYCGSSILVTMTISEKQEKTFCGISITLVGNEGIMVHINVTDSNSQKVHPKEALKKHAVITTFVLPLKEVRIQYRAYKGWFYTGTNDILLKSLVINDDANHIWLQHTAQDMKVATYSETILKV